MDTIVACATPWGRSAVAVVRLSGPETREILERLARPVGGTPPARRARFCRFVDGDEVFDEGLVTIFERGHSYTGEWSAELACHGNPLIVERLIEVAVREGARVADPGEFTRRAHLNGRMDLTRAEAVLQAIEATSSKGLEIARQGLKGEVERLAGDLRDGLTQAIAEIEARLDYPGEELVDESDESLVGGLRGVAERAAAAASSYKSGRFAVDGATVALVGPVNAGKSSLFNALGGSVRAIVSSTPGTTRDVVERKVNLGRVSVTLLDTAGEREEVGELEARGIELGRSMSAEADLLLLVVPAHEAKRSEGLLAVVEGRPHLIVGNHADREGATSQFAGRPMLMTSAKSGEGLEELARAIEEALVGEEQGGAGVIIASQRQRDLLLGVTRGVERSLAELHDGAGFAVAAEELYRALEPLDAMVGVDSREGVLDALFSRFCIGK